MAADLPMENGEITRDSIEKFVENSICEILELAPGSKFSKSTPLMELGLSSLQLMELRARIWKKYDLELQPTFFFQHGTAQAAIKYIIEKKLEIYKDWVYEIIWRKKPLSKKASFLANKLWIILHEENKISDQLIRQLKDKSQKIITVKSGKEFKKLEEQSFVVNPNNPEDFSCFLSDIPNLDNLAGVIYLWGYEAIHAEPSVSLIDDYLKAQCEGLINLANALALSEVPEASRLWVMNKSIFSDGTKESLVQTPYTALCNIIREEHSKSKCTHLALDPLQTVEESVETILSELLENSNEYDIAYRQGERNVPRLVHGVIEKFKQPSFSPDVSYLVSGGLRPLGLEVARWYIDHGAKTVILLDESVITLKIKAEIDLLKALGARVVVYTTLFDNRSNLEYIFESIKSDLPPLKGIIHSAGILHHDLLMHVNWNDSKNVNRLKIAGSWNLHELTQDLDLDHFILFSSSIKELAPMGKASMSIGNAFLDALSHYRNKQGLPSLSIDWSPWELKKMVIEHLTDNELGQFMGILSPSKGMDLLGDLFFLQKPQIMACQVFWEVYFERIGRENPLFEEIKAELSKKRKTEISQENEPVAIIGMACRFPGAKNYREFWDNLVNEVNSVSEIPPDRWDWKAIYGDPKTEPGKTNVKWGGFIDDVDKFDPLFFNISPKEAAYLDPQHRLFLQEAWHAMEDAGYSSDQVAGRKVGVYAGVSKNDYAELMRENHVEIAPYVSTGTVHSILTNRVSYLLDLHGPSESIDTACSSALVALYSAIRDLRTGVCEMAFVGGVNTLLSPTMFLSHTRSGMLSEDGQCKTFDESANGYVRGEGVGVILLKPLKDALKDKDNIHAVILGAAVNHGGKSTGLTAPNVDAQAEVIQSALQDAKIDSQTVTCIEVHGTGTPLGDPIEIDGLKKAFTNVGEKNCVLSAVKTNVGHLESAAGIAGLIKMVLELKYHAIPANIHLKKLNPRISLEESPFTIAQSSQPWDPVDKQGKPLIRRGGVSSFGMGGVNSHVILEEFASHSEVKEKYSMQMIPLSARKGRLQAYIDALSNYLVSHKKIDLESLAYTLQTGRDSFEERVAFAVSSVEELREKLKLSKSSEELSETAKKWMHGEKVNWDEEWKVKPKRLGGLPGYPFQQQRCWFEVKEKPKSEREYRSDQFFLKDHIVAGKSILPGVMYLEIARDAAPQKVSAIRNVNWISPIEAVGESIDLSVQIENQKEFKISEGGVVKCTGELIYDATHRAPENVDIQKLIKDCPHKLDHVEIYKKMEELGLRQGPSLRVLQQFYSSPGFAVGKLVLNSSEDINQFVLHPSLMDGVYQTVVAHHFTEHSMQQYLPFALESVEWFKPLEKEVYAYVEELKDSGTGNVLKYRMKMVSMKGEVIVQFEGFARRPIKQGSKKTLKDIYYIDRWLEKEPVEDRQVGSHVLLFSGDEALQESLQKNLGIIVISISSGSHFEVLSDEKYLINPGLINDYEQLMNDLKERGIRIRDIVYAWDSFELVPILFLIQSIMKSRNFEDLLLLYTYTSSQDLVSAEFAMAAGFGRTLIYENPKMELRSIEMERISIEEKASIIASELRSQERGPLLDVSYKNGVRKVREVVPAPEIEIYSPKKSSFKQGGTYLITGGTGGLGQIFAHYLAENYKANLILMGRSELNDAIHKKIEDLQKVASSVHYLSVDVTDFRALQKAFKTLPENLQKLNGVIHSAGIKIDSFILKKEEASFNQVILPKVKGALNLDALTKEMKLDLMVLLSSIASLIPNQGQSDYAAANSFLDRFAKLRNQKRSGFTLSINFPLWASGGMQVTSKQEEHLKEVFGMEPLPTETGIATFEHLVGFANENKVDQVIVISGDKNKIMKAFGGVQAPVVELSEFLLVDSIEQEGEQTIGIKEIIPDHFYVNGFTHQGKPAVPGACFLEMARQTAEKAFGKDHICIADNFWPIPLEIERGRVTVYTRLNRTGENVSFTISTRDSNNKEIVHASGILKNKHHAEKQKKPDLLSISSNVIKSDQFYETIHGNADLRLFGNFRPVQEFYLGNMEAAAHLVLPKGAPKAKFVIQPMIFTGVEQCLLVFTALTHKIFHPSGMRLMPVSIEAVDIFKPFPESCWLHIIAKKEPSSSNKIQRFDAFLYDEQGETVAVVTGNTMKITPVEKSEEKKAVINESSEDNVENYLKNIMSQVLGINNEEIDSRIEFERYGVTSQMIVELNTLIEKDLGPVSKTLFFEFANVYELAKYLKDQFKNKFGSESTTAVPDIEEVLEYRVPIDTDIAIIGMSGVFPEAKNVQEFWDNLVKGKDSVSKDPLHIDLYQSKLLGQEFVACPFGSSIDEIDLFNPEFFGIAPKEAVLIDPQERVFLQVAYEALLDAGLQPKNLTAEQRHIGVFVGAIWQDYQLIALEESLKGNPVSVSSWLYSIANRVSYIFNFTGTSLSVDTACSSSLTALHLACQSLILGEVQAAIVGGVNLNIHPMKYAFLNHFNFLSSEGKCRSYGEGGEGYVPGEGVCAIVLKPLKAALRDGDPVYAVIKGSATNHGGKTLGYTVPNPALQSEVILQAIERAKINPRDISYVEGHGTGTSLGDPIEIRGLELAYRKFSEDKQYCKIGSVKSNIGHLEGAAGIASVIKVVLQMQNKTLVPSLHSEILNKNIDFAGTPFIVQKKLEPWESDRLRLAAVSSFGAGGSYAHVIIEEAPPGSQHNEKRIHDKPHLANREKYWIHHETTHPLLKGNKIHPDIPALSYLADHKVYDEIIFPGAGYLEMMLIESQTGNLSNVSFEAPLKLDQSKTVQIENKGNELIISSQDENGSRQEHAKGFINSNQESGSLDLEEIKQRCSTTLSHESFYKFMKVSGMNLGPCFQTVQNVHLGNQEAFAEVKLSLPSNDYLAHPSLLDGCIQLVAMSPWLKEPTALYLPVGCDSITIYQALEDHIFVYCQTKESSETSRRGDVTLCTTTGKILGIIRGLNFRKTTEKSFKQLLLRESHIQDLLYEWNQQVYPLESLAQENRRLLVIADQDVPKSIVDLNCTIIPPDAFKPDIIKQESFSAILHLTGLKNPESLTKKNIDEAQRRVTKSALIISQALVKEGLKIPLSFVILSHPIYAPLRGFFKTIHLEQPDLKIKLIEVDEKFDSELLLRACLNETNESIFILRDNQCYVPRFEKIKQLEPLKTSNFRSDATYLITGGYGGIGQTLAKFMIEKGAGHVVLAGRKKHEDLQYNITCDVLDVADEISVKNLIKKLETSKKHLKGIFHLAGVLDDATLLKQDWTHFENVFAPKVYGSYYLHQYAHNLDYFVLFSSITSILGNPGQSNYAAANAFMDALCDYRRNQGLPGMSISWGPWGEVGMAISVKIPWWVPLTLNQAFNCLNYALQQDRNMSVIHIDWAEYLKHLIKQPAWLESFQTNEVGAEVFDIQDEKTLRAFIIDSIRKVLGMSSSSKIDEEKSFFEMGLDSLMVVELKNTLQANLGQKIVLSPTVLFDYSSVRTLTQYLAKEMGF